MPRLALASPALALALLGSLAGTAASAGAATIPCLADAPSPPCQGWSGRVTGISDGDTLDVDIDGDGRGPRRIRITGLNAMELRRYSRTASRRRGDCHAVEATARLEQLVRASGGAVVLTARHASSRSGTRLRRSVAMSIGGRWIDAGRVLVAEGHALWLPHRREWAANAEYSMLAEQAALAGRGIWNTAACGVGPSRTVGGLGLWVNADASGRDARRLNGEWVKIRNLDPVVTVSLAGWWLRDSFQTRFRFPARARLRPGRTLTVHVGRGRSRGRRYHWGLRHAIFENPVLGLRTMGDGAYLFDPQGNLRAWMTYPCRVTCTDPFQSAVAVRAKRRGREAVMLRNLAAAPIDLQAYRLESPPYAYTFRAGTVLQPGASLRIRIGSRRRDTPRVKHWPTRRHILDDRGDVVRLTTYRGVVVACAGWGRGRC